MDAPLYLLAVCLGLHCPVPYRDYQPTFTLSRDACLEQLREVKREHPHETVYGGCLREGGDEPIGSDGTSHYRRAEVR